MFQSFDVTSTPHFGRARVEALRATFDALKHQDSPRSVAARRNLKVSTLQSRRVGTDAEVVAE